MKARYLTITAKCSDLCATTLETEDGDTIHETDGYVPENFGIGGGDYVELKIDLATGQIVDWEPPTREAIEDFINDA